MESPSDRAEVLLREGFGSPAQIVLPLRSSWVQTQRSSSSFTSHWGHVPEWIGSASAASLREFGRPETIEQDDV